MTIKVKRIARDLVNAEMQEKKNMSKEIKIVGPTVKTIWGRKVDLTKVPESSIPQFDGYEFLHLTFIDMKKFKEDVNFIKSLSNVGVRSDNEKYEDVIMGLYSDYMKYGVDLNCKVPPITINND